MIRESDTLSAFDALLDGMISAFVASFVFFGGYGVGLAIGAVIDLALWTLNLPPMPGRGW